MINIIKIYNENPNEPMTKGLFGLDKGGKIYYRSSPHFLFGYDKLSYIELKRLKKVINYFEPYLMLL